MSATWREQLAYAPLEIAERGEEIERRVRMAIELGVLEDGAQLPSESELAAIMGVSTQTLRTALAELRHQGLVETRRGRGGGSFVKANTGAIAKAREETFAAYSVEDLRDIREFRVVLAGSAAAAAAVRSRQIAIERLEALGAMVETVHDPVDMARADSRFHMELAAASRSIRLTRQEMTLQGEMGPLLWMNSPEKGRDAAEDHAGIVDAIRKGDAHAARERAEEHIRNDMNRLIDQRMLMELANTNHEAFHEMKVPRSREDVVVAIQNLADSIETTAASSARVVEAAVHASFESAQGGDAYTLTSVYDVAHRTLTDTTPVLSGVGFLGESSFFGDRALVWAYVPPGRRSPQRLERELQFYDYANAPWWPAGKGENQVHASYAYVEANGSNDYIITFSKKVMRHDAMIGTAAANVSIGELQTLFAPFLDELPPDSCIVDQNDVVIATNSGSLVGGTFSPSGNANEAITFRSLPWHLYVGPEDR